MVGENNPILNSPIMGYAHHRIIYDDTDKPYNYKFLTIHVTFGKLTVLKNEILINRTARQEISRIEKYNTKSIGNYGKIAIEGSERSERYSV